MTCCMLHKGGLGTPEVPFFPFQFGVSLLKLNIRKKGTLIIMGLLGNLGAGDEKSWWETTWFCLDKNG